MSAKTNVVLIGMAGAGKSTLGVLLAKTLALDFVDTDVLIQVEEKRSLQDILDVEGYQVLRRIEEGVLLSHAFVGHVISTGGSAVYGERAMEKLKEDGLVIFLDVDLEVLQGRIHDYESRGIAKRPDQSFASLFEERRRLYNRYADIVIDCAADTPELILLKMASVLASQGG